MGEETTFGQDERGPARLKEVLRSYSECLASRLRRHQFRARTVTIKLRYEDFHTITRSQTQPSPTDQEGEIFQTACQLLDKLDLAGRRVRLIGLQISGFLHPGEMYQMRLLV
jgi:DNA polymerase-4